MKRKFPMMKLKMIRKKKRKKKVILKSRKRNQKIRERKR